MKFLSLFFILLSFGFSVKAEVTVGSSAPLFKAKTHEGKEFDLNSRKGKWTILYFYPKSETPGCTKQACAFRDSIKKIRDKGADIYGVSYDNVESQAQFHKNHSLNFTLLADPEGEVVGKYGTKMPAVNMSKRWTFVLDPELKVRFIDKNVDPAKDAEKMAQTLEDLREHK